MLECKNPTKTQNSDGCGPLIEIKLICWPYTGRYGNIRLTILAVQTLCSVLLPDVCLVSSSNFLVCFFFCVFFILFSFSNFIHCCNPNNMPLYHGCI